MRNSSKTFSKFAITLAVSAVLTACGGGGSDSEDSNVDGSGGGGSGDTGIGGSPLFDGGMVGDSNRACNSGQGTDNASVDEDWSNNCHIQVDPTDDEVSETFAESFYTTGIQRIVWCLGLDPSPDAANPFIDQDYGPRTKGAVESFQSQQGITIDGIVGSETWAALQDSLTSVGSNSFSEAWAVADPLYTEFEQKEFNFDCVNQPVVWQYLYPDDNVRAWTLTDKDENGSTDTTTFGRTSEKFFGNTF